MDAQTIASYLNAGKIAKQAMKFARALCKEGAKYLDIVNKTEEQIKSLGGELAFPMDLSVNEIAAHDTPPQNDKRVLKKSDLVKLDLGVHVNGYIADMASSISIGSCAENDALIFASEQALDAAIKALHPGVPVNALGSAISASLPEGINVIKNLRGHSLNQYNLHSKISIDNFKTSNTVPLKNVAIAVEPFTTKGVGWVIDSKGSGVYDLTAQKPIRFGRDVLEYIQTEFKTLPFSARQLIKKFGPLKTRLALKEMLNKGLLCEYAVLKEKTERKVAQTEHTILILEDKVIVTTK